MRPGPSRAAASHRSRHRTRQAFAVVTRDLRFHYGNVLALKSIDIEIPRNQVTAFIGPSGCGKSTLLRCFNRMNDLIDDTRVEGQVLIDGEDIYRREVQLEALRKRVGMVFQKSNPVPMSIYENLTFGPRMRGIRDKSTLEGIVEHGLRRADLWREVKDRLKDSALALSGGQQQRLCIARTLANDPRSSSWTSPPRLSIRSPPARSKRRSTSSKPTTRSSS
jgi:phosphate transport system ATP-binding protein